MSDTIPALDPSVAVVAQDVLNDAALAKQIVTEAHKDGAVKALTAHLSDLISAAQHGYNDVTAALPAFKAGYKTTEFWLAVSVILGNGLYFMFSGKALPVDLNVVVGAIVIVYAAVRTLAKLYAPAPVPVPAPPAQAPAVAAAK